MKRLLQRMAEIEDMERGKLCQMPGRQYYNLQAWRNGRNEVRYIPAQEVPQTKKAIEGYQLFCELAEQYADEVVQISRRERESKKREKQARRKKS